ncbi:hypothetical protein ACP4OV_026645 [Aristida adscensionis]
MGVALAGAANFRASGGSSRRRLQAGESARAMPAERVRGLASDNNGAGAKIGDRGHFAGGNRCLGAWRTHRPQRRLMSQPLPPATILAYSMVRGVDQRSIQINSSGKVLG